MITALTAILGIAFVLVSIFLILIVLIQPGGQRGGGLGGLGGGSAGGAISETLGATEGERTLARWTAIGMGVFFLLAIALTVLANIGPPSVIPLDDETPAPAAVPGTDAGVGDPALPQGTEVQLPEGIQIETVPPADEGEAPIEGLGTED